MQLKLFASDHLIILRLFHQDALNVLSKDRTTLIVAHRLSTITHADKIVVIENGEIVEVGNHETLLSKKGAYEHLYSIQNL